MCSQKYIERQICYEGNSFSIVPTNRHANITIRKGRTFLKDFIGFMFLALCFQMPGPWGNMFWIRKCINKLYLTICKMSISNISPAFISLIKKWGLAGKSSCFQVYENINESRIRTNIDFIFLFCFSILLSLSFLNPKKSFIQNHSFNYWY